MDHLPGTIYLLHFDRPCKHARHYLGKSESSQFLNGCWLLCGRGVRGTGRLPARCRAGRAASACACHICALDAMARAAAEAGLSAQEITRTIRSAQRGRERRPFTNEREAG